MVIDLYRNATAEYADYLLPATDWLEREDINVLGAGLQPRPWLQYSPAAIKPKDQRRDEWWIFARLQQAMRLPSLLDQPSPDPLAFSQRLLAASDLNLDELRSSDAHTIKLPLAEADAVFTQGIQLPDQRVDCCPPVFSDALQTLELQFRDAQSAQDDRLQLITLRNHYMHNSWMQNVSRLKRKQHLSNPLHMHPDDASARQLEQQSTVMVSSDFGAIEAQIHLDETLMRGVVAMTHGWGNSKTPGMPVANAHPGVNVNQLLPQGPGSFDPLSNQAFMSGVRVSVAEQATAAGN